MSFASKLRYNQLPVAATGLAGAAPQVGAGNNVLIQKLQPGSTLVAKISMVVKTSSLTMTPSWQGSNDGTNWENLFGANSAANVATAAGTGSTVTTARSIMLPSQPVPYKYVRAIVTTAGATAVLADDTYAISYHWVEKDFT